MLFSESMSRHAACLLPAYYRLRRIGFAWLAKPVFPPGFSLPVALFDFLKKLFYLAVILVAGLVLAGWLRSQGVIPSSTDALDPEYRKLCGVEPTSGGIWSWRVDNPSGGFAYYRLSLSNNSYGNRGSSVLTGENQPDLPGSPWWWGAASSGRASVQTSGSAMNKSRRYEIYDPDAELLYVYGEW